MSDTNITHYNLAVAAFNAQRHRVMPTRRYRELWISNWIANHVAQLVRDQPGYDRYYALKRTRNNCRVTRQRLDRYTNGAPRGNRSQQDVRS